MNNGTPGDGPDLKPLLAKIWDDAEGVRAEAASRLHDDQAGDIVGLLMDLVLLRKALTGNSDVASKLDHFTEVLNRSLKTNRELVEMLRPSLLDNIGLVAALKWRLMALSKAHSVEFTTGVGDLDLPVDAALGLHLYRICEAWLEMSLISGDISGVHLLFSETEATHRLISVQVTGNAPIVADLAASQLSARAEVAGARLAITQQSDGATLVIRMPR